MKQFDEDFYTFRAEIKELERRLGSVRSLDLEGEALQPQPGPTRAPAFAPSPHPLRPWPSLSPSPSSSPSPSFSPNNEP